MIQIHYLKDYNTLSEYAANLVCQAIADNQGLCNLGLPTGSTPLGMYSCLKDKKLDWTHVKTFNLDEYLDVKDYRYSYEYYMNNNFHSHVNIQKENIFFPNEDCNYDELISLNNGLDLTVLGIGRNGHIAFNEPGSLASTQSRIVKLCNITKKANSKYFLNKTDIPEFAITMGISTILKSKKILLIVAGRQKLKVLKQAIWEDVTSKIPASYLQTHKNLTIAYCD